MVPPTPAALDAAWLEEVLREGQALPEARVRGISTQIIGVGYGLDGTSARVSLDGEGVPATLVAKWCSAQNARWEERFYREVAPRLDIPLATLLGERIDAEGARGVLLLSDVAPARQGDTVVGATEAESDALTDVMARLHAPFWGGAGLPDLAPVPRWAGDGPGQAARVAEALPRFLAAWTGRLPRAALALAAELPERVQAAVGSLGPSPVTLVHADLHLDNVLFLGDGTPVVLDWPSACRGAAALDLARLLVEGMTSVARRARQDRLMRRYLAALEARGVRYDLERLRSDVGCVATLLYGAAVRWAGGPLGGRTARESPRCPAGLPHRGVARPQLGGRGGGVRIRVRPARPGRGPAPDTAPAETARASAASKGPTLQETPMGDTKDKIKDGIDKAADKTKAVAGKVVDKTKDVTGKAVDKTKDAARATGDAVKRAGEKIKDAGKR